VELGMKTNQSSQLSLSRYSELEKLIVANMPTIEDYANGYWAGIVAEVSEMKRAIASRVLSEAFEKSRAGDPIWG
jgi:hypothetical protein